jgi:hypothetical protein
MSYGKDDMKMNDFINSPPAPLCNQRGVTYYGNPVVIENSPLYMVSGIKGEYELYFNNKL